MKRNRKEEKFKGSDDRKCINQVGNLIGKHQVLVELCLQNLLEVKAKKIVIFDQEGKNERTDANIANKVEEK